MASVLLGPRSTYMGHANISITLDRYGHLMSGNEDEAAGLLNPYLVRSDSQPGSPPWRPEKADWRADWRALAR